MTNQSLLKLHILEHMDYVRQLIGVDYIGLGSDFDGME